jgi:hypothetical protein
MLATEDSGEGAAALIDSSIAAERRRGARHPQRLPLVLSIFNRPGAQEAWLVNCSQEGICVETAQPLRQGTSVQLRVVASVSSDEPVGGKNPLFPGLPTTALGEVKWCITRGPGRSPRYSIGIRYYPHY